MTAIVIARNAVTLRQSSGEATQSRGSPRRVCMLLAMTLTAAVTSSLAQTHDVSPELWDRPRSAAAIAGDEGVKRAAAALIARPEARLVIHHAAGHEPLLHAEELKSWLGALAIDTRRIVLRNDLAAGSPLKIEVVQ